MWLLKRKKIENPILILNDENDGFKTIITLYIEHKMFEVYQTYPDGEASIQNYKFKFDGEQVFHKLIESKYNYPGGCDWNIRDGVVLESEFRQRPSLNNIENKIEEFKNQLQWVKLLNFELQIFIMSYFRELIPLEDLRRIIRTEMENLKLGVQKITEYAKSSGLEVIETELGMNFLFPKNMNELNRENFNKSAESLFTSMSFDWQKVKTFKLMLKKLSKILGD